MLKKIRKFALNRKGFSLVELMIVVAIIGMLAAVGIPQYAKFQAKARQSESKSNLAGIFNAMKSFQSEWNTYTNHLGNAGFGVEGKNLRYTTGFLSGVSCAITPAAGYAGPPETTGASQTWSRGDSNTVNATWHNQVWYTNHTTAVNTSCGQNGFIALSAGDPRNNPVPVDLGAGTNGDRWTIDQSKDLRNVNMGIN